MKYAISDDTTTVVANQVVGFKEVGKQTWVYLQGGHCVALNLTAAQFEGRLRNAPPSCQEV